MALMLLRVVAWALGAACVAGALRSATGTFVLPRAAPDPLVRRAFELVRLVFNVLTRRANTYEARDGIMALYAPVSLLLLPAVWLTVVFVGYAAMYWAMGVADWSTALTLSGSSLLTLGVAGHQQSMVVMLFVFTEAATGLILIALLISYLPVMYNAFSRRETAVTRLEIRIGSPAEAPELLIRFKQIGLFGRLGELWMSWEGWFAELEETHTSLAALAYFRSPQHDRSWITAAGAVLDAASIALSAIDVTQDPHAELCLRAGTIALQRIASFFNIAYVPDPPRDAPISVSRVEFDQALDRLAAAGIPLVADRDGAWREFSARRAPYDAVLLAIATLTMAPYAPWSSDRSLPRNSFPSQSMIT